MQYSYDRPTKRHPKSFTVLLFQGRKVEDVSQNNSIKDFDADISIQNRSDERGDEGNRVADRLPRKCRVWDALISWVLISHQY